MTRSTMTDAALDRTLCETLRLTDALTAAETYGTDTVLLVLCPELHWLAPSYARIAARLAEIALAEQERRVA